MMGALAIKDQTTTTRPLFGRDALDILKIIDTAWRVHLRIFPFHLETKLKMIPGVVAEDHVGIRGFMIIEPQSSQSALIVAAGLRDTWSIKPYLDYLLPEIEQIARTHNLKTLTHVGHDGWLVNDLLERGFKTQDWIINFERSSGPDTLPSIPQIAHLRTAHLNDLPAIKALDSLVFDHMWQKSPANINEALARAASFIVAEWEEDDPDQPKKIVGYTWCEIYHHRAHLTRLAIHPHYQRRGIGAQLLHQTIREVLAQEADLITLNTQASNPYSRILYERFGFVSTESRIPVLEKKLT